MKSRVTVGRKTIHSEYRLISVQHSLEGAVSEVEKFSLSLGDIHSSDRIVLSLSEEEAAKVVNRLSKLLNL